MVDYNNKKLLRQDARSLRMKNQPNGALGHPLISTANLWFQLGITLDVKMFTFQPLPANR
jgi:hypothetical protein